MHYWKHQSDIGVKEIGAFDYVEQFIANAKQVESNINSFVADATDLSKIEDDKLVYLQQVICFIPATGIDDAFKEAYRICKNEGVVIFSFLDYDGRKINTVFNFFLGY